MSDTAVSSICCLVTTLMEAAMSSSFVLMRVPESALDAR